MEQPQFNEWLSNQKIPANCDEDKREIVKLLAAAWVTARTIGREQGYALGLKAVNIDGIPL